MQLIVAWHTLHHIDIWTFSKKGGNCRQLSTLIKHSGAALPGGSAANPAHTFLKDTWKRLGLPRRDNAAENSAAKNPTARRQKVFREGGPALWSTQ